MPIIVKISTKAIFKDFGSENKYKNADWDKFKSTIDRKVETDINNEPLEGGGINQEKIDTAITNWIDIVKDAQEESVPKGKVNYYIHSQVSDYIKLLEQNYKQLISLTNWNRENLIKLEFYKNS